MELSSPNVKKLIFFQKKFFFLIFQKGTCEAQKTKISCISGQGTL